MAKRNRTVKVTSAEAGAHLRKALDHLKGATNELVEGNWNSAGLLAIHASISANDALLGLKAGVRHGSEDHRAAAGLLQSFAPPGATEWKQQADRLARIVAKKNLVAYEGREVSDKEAADLVEQARRFIGWVRENVPSG